MIRLPKKGRNVLMPCARDQYPFEAPEGPFSRTELKRIGVQPARIWLGEAEALGASLVQCGLVEAAPLALKPRSSWIFGALAFVTLPPLDLKLRHLRLARRSAAGFRRGFYVLNLDILPTASRGRDLIGLGLQRARLKAVDEAFGGAQILGVEPRRHFVALFGGVLVALRRRDGEPHIGLRHALADPKAPGVE